MHAAKIACLETLAASFQQRWGTKTLQRLSIPADQRAAAPIPTGFPVLDQALGASGIPRGRITEMLGAPTSGMVTLALQVIASAQAKGDIAVYLDLSQTFDPDYAARWGVHLEDLLLVHPRSRNLALEMVHDLLAGGGVGILVFDGVTDFLLEPDGAQRMSTALRRLASRLAKTSCALLFLTPLQRTSAQVDPHQSSGHALPFYATLRLAVEKERWVLKRGDVQGYQTRVTVLKNKLAPPGPPVTLRIACDGVDQGGSL